MTRSDEPISVFVLWQSLVVSSYRSFFAALAARGGLRIALAAPAKFRELAQQDVSCAPFAPPFQADDATFPAFKLAAWRPHVQIVYYRGLRRALRRFVSGTAAAGARPIFLCLAEPYSITALLAWFVGRLAWGRSFAYVVFGLQNINKRLPLPLKLSQAFVFAKADTILSLGDEQTQVLRQQGYQGQVTPFPLWFDSRIFRPGATPDGGVTVDGATVDGIKVGFAGGLTAAKGILDLLGCWEQQAQLWSSTAAAPCELLIAGAGALATEIETRCQQLQRRGFRVRFLGPLAAEAMPDFYRRLDILVVPSRTMPHWKEQFGRVIVEARACGVVALGSSSGAIPQVVGGADRVFAEGDVVDLARVLGEWIARLRAPEARAQLRADEAASAFQEYSDITLAERFAAILPMLAASTPPRSRWSR